MTKLTQKTIEELKKRSKTATEAPWAACEDDGDVLVVLDDENNEWPSRYVLIARDFSQGNSLGLNDAIFVAVMRNNIDALVEAAEGFFSLTSVLPCEVVHEHPYDFDYCIVHDRTFAMGTDCDYKGLSEMDYLDKVAHEQRYRAIIAEDRLEDALEKISQLTSEKKDANE